MRQVSLFKRRIRKHFRQATNTKGIYWYQNANQYCQMLSKLTGYPLRIVVGVMATLSPNNKWEQNKKDCESLLINPRMSTKVCTFNTQKKKALRIIRDLPSETDILTILNGEKTKNFFDNILNFKYSNNVTVDRWAYRSCGVDTKTKYMKDIITAYQEVAQEFKLRPHQLQAVVWEHIRR